MPTQRQMAELVGISQNRTSAVERGDVSVSFDLMAEAFFAMGKTRFDLAKVLAGELFRPAPATTKAQVKRSPRAAKKAAAVARAKRAPRRKTV